MALSLEGRGSSGPPPSSAHPAQVATPTTSPTQQRPGGTHAIENRSKRQAESARDSREEVDARGVMVPTVEEFTALAARVTELEQRLADATQQPHSPYLTVFEAAELLRCKRQRVDDLMSQRRLSRYKDGSRTLVSRAEVDEYLRKHRR